MVRNSLFIVLATCFAKGACLVINKNQSRQAFKDPFIYTYRGDSEISEHDGELGHGRKRSYKTNPIFDPKIINKKKGDFLLLKNSLVTHCISLDTSDKLHTG